MARLICFILIFAIFLAFMSLNLKNHCNVSLGFYDFEEIPVYVSAMVSFFLGMLCTIPILLSFKGRKHEKQGKEKPGKKNKSSDTVQDEAPREIEPYGVD